MPYVGLLQEHNVQDKGSSSESSSMQSSRGFPEEFHPPLKFAYITGWRFKSEVLPLTVAQVDLKAGFVRLEVGTTKSGEGRSFYVTTELRKVRKAQLAIYRGT